MSKKVVRLLLPPKRNCEQSDFPTIAFCTAVLPNDPVVCCDTTPSQDVACEREET